ncbi:WG repeat-containing protein [Breznakiella homolactica]|uniref:WG repeat-containing protein n=1 Tax=Breznakiella homolactica TaxID=2798577 RepID=A0A7T8BAF3_9SPIR|nr:WG repeat-containing protein [Breznakiella homolactica]QQO10609.1 WG repeat-containing protein [Breznakiella homolactica]
MWDEIRHTTNGMTPVCKNNKWGAVDQNGEVVISPAWDFISWVTAQGQAIVWLEDKSGVVGSGGGLVIPLVWDDIQFVTRGFTLPGNDVLYKVKKIKGDHRVRPSDGRRRIEIWGYDCLQGIADTKGNYLIDPVWDEIDSIEENIAVVCRRNDSGHHAADGTDTRTYGAIELGSGLIIEPIYECMLPFHKGYAWVKEGYKWGLINSSGGVVQKPQWPGVSRLSCSGYYKANRYGGWGVLRYDGVMAADFLWDDIRCINGRIEGKKHKKWTAIIPDLTQAGGS